MDETNITAQFVTEPSGRFPIFSGSWWIRFGTHSRFSHVDIVYPDGTLVGARDDFHVDWKGKYNTGVQRRPADYANFSVRERVVVPVTPDEQRVIYQFLDAQIGKPYDESAIAGFVLGRDWRSPRAWFCSELGAAAFEHANVVQVLTPESKITPNDYYLLCGAAGGRRQVFTPKIEVRGGEWAYA
ncbi:MAG: hypothetical protein KGL39_03540 [Patescibacteria group bacterium]|nr:hypothetical protein [Patescibacteria group bacterium]